MTGTPNGTTWSVPRPGDPFSSAGGYRELGHGKMRPLNLSFLAEEADQRVGMEVPSHQACHSHQHPKT